MGGKIAEPRKRRRDVRWLSRLLCGLICLCLSGSVGACHASRPGSAADSFRYYNQVGGLAFSSPGGFYHMDLKGFLYFFDYAAKKDILVCSKPQCKHESWNEETPVEERCQAYLNGDAVGFMQNEKLYLICMPANLKTAIVRSNADRSQQTKLASFEGGYIFSFAVKGEMLYLAMDEPQMAEKQGGGKNSTNRRLCRLMAVDLTNGRRTDLIKPMESNNNSLRILDADGSKLYLAYGYFEKPFDGNNYKEAKYHNDYFVYDTEQKTLAPILKKWSAAQSIVKAAVLGDKMLAVTVTSSADAEAAPVLDLIDLKSETVRTLANCERVPVLLDKVALYMEKGSGPMQEYDLQTKKSRTFAKMRLEDIFIYHNAGDYFYVGKGDPKTQKRTHGFYKKSDLYEGKTDAFIPVH